MKYKEQERRRGDCSFYIINKPKSEIFSNKKIQFLGGGVHEIPMYVKGSQQVEKK